MTTAEVDPDTRLKAINHGAYGIFKLRGQKLPTETDRRDAQVLATTVINELLADGFIIEWKDRKK